MLPPALQFGQNNTQTGVGVSFSHTPFGALTNLGANATYSTTTLNNTTGSARRRAIEQRQCRVSTSSTRFGPKTSGSAGVDYSWFDSPGGGTNTGNVVGAQRLCQRQPHLSRPAHVRNLLRAHGQALPAQSGSGLLLRQPAAPARDGVPRIRPAPERRLHRRHRRGRRRQDHDRAQPARQARSGAGRRRQPGQHAARRRRHAAPGGIVVRPAHQGRREVGSAARAGGLPGLGVPAGQARAAHRRRSAEPDAARGRGAAHAVELPARDPCAAAELPRRAAGIPAHDAEPAHAAAAPARDRRLPHRPDGRSTRREATSSIG